MHLKFTLPLICFLSVFGFSGITETECALPFGIFPFLTTGWYYKPSPVESVVLGLIVVKVLALRLASITGLLPIPYHLNDLFVRSLGKRSIHEYFDLKNLTMPQSNKNLIMSNQTVVPHKTYARNRQERKDVIRDNELAAMYRVLLGLRRIDTSDCFLKMLCFISQKLENGKASLDDKHLLATIRYLSTVEKNAIRGEGQNQLDISPVMDVYEKALMTGRKSKLYSDHSACDSEYLMCPLTEDAMMFEALISDLF